LALLGYIFNFSILYSNYALEAFYGIKVFKQRIHSVIKEQEESEPVAHMATVVQQIDDTQ